MSAVRQVLALLSCAMVALMVQAAEFRLVTGDVFKGELSAADKDGFVIRLDSGDFSPRIDWAKLSDETLKDLADNPKARRFVEPFIEPPSETIALQQAKEIPVKQPARVELPEVKKGLAAALTSPNGLILLGVLFFANLYGAYEIARFKWRPVALVCGTSAILPVLGPLIFLVLPRHTVEAQESATETAVQQTHLGVPVGGAVPASGGGVASALGVAKGGGSATQQEGLPKIFKRGDITFNRRFFETQFPTFFRVGFSEADKDLVIEIAAGKHSVVAVRISRISANDVFIKTATNQEVQVPFAEMVEVKLRSKDTA